jgi:hypothetical protein
LELTKVPSSPDRANVDVGALLLAAFAFTWHNLVRRGGWPERWW